MPQQLISLPPFPCRFALVPNINNSPSISCKVLSRIGVGLGDPDLHWQVAFRQNTEYTGAHGPWPCRLS
jgi:hypothetical protein